MEDGILHLSDLYFMLFPSGSKYKKESKRVSVVFFFFLNSFREKGTFSKLGLKFGPYSRKRTLHGKTQ